MHRYNVVTSTQLGKKYYESFLSLSLKYLVLNQITFFSLENFGIQLQETSWEVHCEMSFYVILLLLTHSWNIKWKNVFSLQAWLLSLINITQL